MGVLDTVREWVWRFLAPGEYADTERRKRLESMALAYEYYQGNQRRFIKTKTGQADDNLILNYTGLVVDRSLSLLLGGGIGFDLPGDENPGQEWIDAVWDANRRDILAHKAAQYAALFGTGYLKLVPNAIETDGRLYHRLLALDSRWMSIETMPNDVDTVTAYEARYHIVENGQGKNKKERIEAVDIGPAGARLWLVRQLEMGRSGRWEEVEAPIEWPYSFAPIVHWQNLPQPGSPYGASDIDDVMELQDRINFVSSNISRIIRYHAHPKTWGRGTGSRETQSWGADEMVVFTSADAMLANLEMQSDLASSAAYLLSLRQSLFDVSRTVDISSMADKLGALTNFGLRVLYTDALAKLATKQALMGEALQEVNRRLLVIDNFADTEPGEVIWPDNMPSNAREDVEVARMELDAGLVSKQTLAAERGRDWETEQERLSEEQTAGTNIGDVLLQNFNRGL